MTVDYKAGKISSLSFAQVNFLAGDTPLFHIFLRCKNGEGVLCSAWDADAITQRADGWEYTFRCGIKVLASAELTEESPCAVWFLSVKNESPMAVEYVQYPNIPFAPLEKNGGTGRILLPYNEGVIIDDATQRDKHPFFKQEIKYPSKGSCYLFPNMMSSQFMAYLSRGCGVYMGAHDPHRGVKGLDYVATKTGVTMGIRTYAGGDFGKDYTLDFPIVTTVFEGDWEDAANLYRQWFSQHLPANVKKVSENESLPQWYRDFPLIVAYPVRGLHDMDEMRPNGFFPYINALPYIEEIAEATQARILALLMHWEGTAPWAPPYVWPPYGGEQAFNELRDALHRQGHLLGVYCSGFGWTYQSNLTDYNRIDEWNSGAVKEAMCAGPDGQIASSNICTGQRSGYDLCPASEKARKILKQAYSPLFSSGIDYAQILDQNHGGGQYLCYSREHGHPPVPGSWMTENMQSLLSDWNQAAPHMLFGCESAAAEPFIGNLLFSDNRYELNHYIGRPVPLYAYLYHEYLHNFMGNQVASPLACHTDTLCAQLAYSFTAGDCMTLVMLPGGELLPFWGYNEQWHPDKEKVLRFIKNLMRFYTEEAKPYLLFGRMEKALPVNCPGFRRNDTLSGEIVLPKIFSTAWHYNGKTVQIFVNASDEAQTIKVGRRAITVEALSGTMLEL